MLAFCEGWHRRQPGPRDPTSCVRQERRPGNLTTSYINFYLFIFMKKVLFSSPIWHHFPTEMLHLSSDTPHSAKDEQFNFHLPSLGLWSLTFFSLSVHSPKVAILSWKLISLLFPNSDTPLTESSCWECISLFLSGCWPLLAGVFLCGFFTS